MNVACTYKTEAVNIVDVTPSEISGFLDIQYVDSADILKYDRIPYAKNIADTITAISGSMNVACTYKAESVNIVKVMPHQQTGFLNVVYADSADILKVDVIAYIKNIADTVTSIG
jgi:hypothetical protein